MVMGRGGAGERLVFGLVFVMPTIVEIGCLTRQHVDDTTASTGASTDDPDTTAGGSTMDPEIMTTTETPETTAPATCDDGEANGDETDVDCGGPDCSPCAPGQMCDGNGDCAAQACAAGECVLPACDDDDDCAGAADACTRARCGPGFTCVVEPDHEGEPCEDGVTCSIESTCQDGVCTATLMVDCTAFDSPCTAGLCDPLEGACFAVNTPDGTACDDGDGCTRNSACEGGSCVSADSGALLFEDFAGAAQGWTFDGLWEVGPASASTNGTGGADPTQDHSPGPDNGLAGVAIGKLDQTVSHAAWCLTSPPVDAMNVGPTLYVSFWHHLHAPAQPQVIHTVDVWNGISWQNLETGYPALSDDAEWTFVSHDASSHQAPDFRVRICEERKAGAPDYAGWSVDDVTIAATACTP